MYTHDETGAGLVEYTPLILFLIFCCVSLFQVVVEGDRSIVWIIGSVLFVLLFLFITAVTVKDKMGQNKENSS